MATLFSRQGRELQRYTEGGHRLVVGCIPYKFERDEAGENDIAVDQVLQVLLVSAQKGRDMMFPRGGWESDESIEEATSREAMEEAGVLGDVEEELGRWWYQSKSHDSRKVGIMFPMNVTEELRQWPEMDNRRRRWVTVTEAREVCRQAWMLEALDILVARLSCRPRTPHGNPFATTTEQRNQEPLTTNSRGRLDLVSEPAAPTTTGKAEGEDVIPTAAATAGWIVLLIRSRTTLDAYLVPMNRTGVVVVVVAAFPTHGHDPFPCFCT